MEILRTRGAGTEEHREGRNQWKQSKQNKPVFTIPGSGDLGAIESQRPIIEKERERTEPRGTGRESFGNFWRVCDGPLFGKSLLPRRVKKGQYEKLQMRVTSGTFYVYQSTIKKKRSFWSSVCASRGYQRGNITKKT